MVEPGKLIKIYRLRVHGPRSIIDEKKAKRNPQDGIAVLNRLQKYEPRAIV